MLPVNGKALKRDLLSFNNFIVYLIFFIFLTCLCVIFLHIYIETFLSFVYFYVNVYCKHALCKHTSPD